ncbi:Mor transcription activator family protein [Providencia zhijiangensis]|uniref:Mor transcription activator family protein n=1 Tax=Providencia zhijiangensis TaxID=3053982 RepID=A0ABZ0MY62_9GAMM|nr:Mor transcription activator family protein [Providencia sp. D4759]WPA91030.1 Mor transcription activator family protein [Providencia sp. D4759]
MDLKAVEHLLPDTLRHIAGLIGYPDTLKLIEVFGGTTFVFTKSTETERFKLLSHAIGDQSAVVLQTHFGGTEIYIPNASAAMREWRNQRFISEYNALLKGGLSGVKAVIKLCPKFGFSDRHAWDLLSRYKQSAILTAKQPNLF